MYGTRMTLIGRMAADFFILAKVRFYAIFLNHLNGLIVTIFISVNPLHPCHLRFNITFFVSILLKVDYLWLVLSSYFYFPLRSQVHVLFLLITGCWFKEGVLRADIIMKHYFVLCR